MEWVAFVCNHSPGLNWQNQLANSGNKDKPPFLISSMLKNSKY